MCVYAGTGDFAMNDRKEELKDQINELKRIRKLADMNRTQFSEYMGIPRRTLEEWEGGRRQMPDYVLRLIAYYVEMKYMTDNSNK